MRTFLPLPLALAGCLRGALPATVLLARFPAVGMLAGRWLAGEAAGLLLRDFFRPLSRAILELKRVEEVIIVPRNTDGVILGGGA